MISDQCRISFRARATGADLTLRVALDGHVFWEGTVPTDQDQLIQHTFAEQDNVTHELHIELCGKSPSHTRLDGQGNIVEDRVVHIEDFSMDDIELGHLLYSKSRYEHNHNGTTESGQHGFYGVMGCNGVVSLSFTSPAYLWLLEHT